MIRFTFLILFILILTLPSKAQVFSITDSDLDELYVDFTTSFLSPEGEKFGMFNRGANITILLNLVEVGNKFGISPGLGISNVNFYLKDPDDFREETRKYKYSQTFLEVPLEFQFRTKPKKKSLKFSLGAKGGYLISNKQKIKSDYGDVMKFKYRFVKDFQYGVYARAGYSFISLYAYYGLVEFSKNAPYFGSNLISVGVSVGGL